MDFTVKSKLCVFCTSGIFDDGVQSQFENISDFAKGVSVLCQVLKIETNLTLEENWDLGGNFLPSLVCCSKCGILLDKLVSLHQLLVETQTRLEQNARKVEHSVVNSRKQGLEVEYSVRACLELREEIVRNYEKGLEFISVPECDQVSSVDDNFLCDDEENESNYSSKSQENPKTNHSQIADITTTTKTPKFESNPTQIDNGVRECFVSLQHITTPSKVDPKIDPVPKKRGRGRPRKYQEGEPRPKRIRTKKKKVEKTSVVKDEFLDDSFSSFSTRKLRSRKTTDNIEAMFPNAEHDAEKADDDEDEDYQPECSRSSSSCGSIRDDINETSPISEAPKREKRSPLQRIKKTMGRPPKPPEFKATKLKRRPQHLTRIIVRPFFVVDKTSGIYIFHSVKIQREGFTLYCKHPGCNFSAGGMENFRDQEAFGKMREHIQNIHRPVRKSNAKAEDTLTNPNSKFYCWICDDVSFAAKRKLDDHFKSEHKNPEQLFTVCEICGWVSRRMNCIASHRESHQSAEEQAKVLAEVLKKRKRGPHYVNPRTKNPGSNFISIFVVNEALRVFMFLNVKLRRDDDNRLICKFPGCNFSSGKMQYFADQDVLIAMKDHVRKAHRKIGSSKNTPTSYYCWRCDKYLDTMPLYRLHLKTEHKNETESPLTLCEICGERMIRANMVKHRHSHQNEEERKLNPLPKIKTEKDSFPCGKCDKVYSKKRSLYKHTLTHLPHEQRYRFQCEICGSKSISTNALNTHRRLVHFRESAEAKFACPICDKKFVAGEKSAFDYHLRIHSGERPYQCTECGMNFRAKCTLDVHQKVHHSGEVVACEFCPKMTNPKNLRLHQLKHHRDLMEESSECMPKRGRKTLAVTRPDFIGPILAFPCEPCGRVYKVKSKLVDHMKIKHKIILPRNADYPSANLIDHKSEGFY